jgi:hypothetical protein
MIILFLIPDNHTIANAAIFLLNVDEMRNLCIALVQTISYIVQMTLLKSSTTITHEPRQRTIEILPSGVGDFPVLPFLLVFDFISCLDYSFRRDDHFIFNSR